MPIGKALLLKGLGGLTALGGAIGGVCYIHNLYSNQETTRFDEGLIDYLKAGGDIQFSVKNGTSDVSDSFPDFTNGTTPPTATVTIKVSVATSGTTDGTLTDATSPTPVPVKGKKETLQNLNKGSANTGTAWTWECKIVFEKTETATGTELKDKDKLVQSSTPKGFFDKLKDTDGNTKDLKKEFIKNCAKARGIAENRKINKLENLASTTPTNNKIESTKTFKLIDNSEATKKLIPKDQSDFNYWFANIK